MKAGSRRLAYPPVHPWSMSVGIEVGAHKNTVFSDIELPRTTIQIVEVA